MIYLDTHVVAWLYGGRSDLFPGGVRSRLETDDLVISPVVHLELQYLYEVGKATEPATAVIAALDRILNVRVCPLPFETVTNAALDLVFTRDPFDRLITAQAQAAEAPLITKDRGIRAHYARAVWE